ncbi:MAG: SMP-30/gluconolactonase/LRE family protein, partial [Gemmataceae bacterium]|nr:SMP-30/gluconolactonase/LRE family protein [Gemmataceae bacterium]MDW8267213.1 SMP-30/gluconolactonase/LRE family protein [Gemmataceae bacterium]
LIDGEEWHAIGVGFKSVEAMWVDATGNIHVVDPSNTDHNLTVLSPDGAVLRGSRITLEPGLRLATRNGRFVYSLLPGQKTLRLHDVEQNTSRDLALPVAQPSGLTFTPDEGTLVVGDAAGKHLWAFRVEKDGSLTCAEPYYPLRIRPGETASGVTALTVDADGRLYACTPVGIQMFDPTGRLSGVLLNPSPRTPTAIAFAGPERDVLVVSCGDSVYGRRLKARGVALTRR